MTAAPMVRAGPLRWPAALWISLTGVAFSWEDTASLRGWKGRGSVKTFQQKNIDTSSLSVLCFPWFSHHDCLTCHGHIYPIQYILFLFDGCGYGFYSASCGQFGKSGWKEWVVTFFLYINWKMWPQHLWALDCLSDKIKLLFIFNFHCLIEKTKTKKNSNRWINCEIMSGSS